MRGILKDAGYRLREPCEEAERSFCAEAVGGWEGWRAVGEGEAGEDGCGRVEHRGRGRETEGRNLGLDEGQGGFTAGVASLRGGDHGVGPEQRMLLPMGVMAMSGKPGGLTGQPGQG